MLHIDTKERIRATINILASPHGMWRQLLFALRSNEIEGFKLLLSAGTSPIVEVAFYCGRVERIPFLNATTDKTTAVGEMLWGLPSNFLELFSEVEINAWAGDGGVVSWLGTGKPVTEVLA
jgi:hypothetical protein